MDNFSASREYPHSPASISPISSRRDSLRQHSDKSSDPPTPNSPPMRLTRKRAASLNTDAANVPPIEDLGLDSARLGGPQSAAREQVCLCQPDPKIPRPRNGMSEFKCHVPKRADRLRLPRTQSLCCPAEATSILLTLDRSLCSFHPLSPTSSSPSRRAKPRPRES